MAAMTTVKISASDHQALIALLKLHAKAVDNETFIGMMKGQGRIEKHDDDIAGHFLPMLAEYMVRILE